MGIFESICVLAFNRDVTAAKLACQNWTKHGEEQQLKESPIVSFRASEMGIYTSKLDHTVVDQRSGMTSDVILSSRKSTSNNWSQKIGIKKNYELIHLIGKVQDMRKIFILPQPNKTIFLNVINYDYWIRANK